MKRFVPTLLVFLITWSISAQATWFGGSARIKITPDEGLVMAGYASRTTPNTSVKQDIWAKVVVIEDENGKRAAIITTDLIGFSNKVTPAIYEGIRDRTGIERKDVLLTWSHTHSAPRLTLEETAQSGTTEKDRQNSVAYTKKLQAQIVHLVELATRSLQPVELHLGKGFAGFVMNRRERNELGIRLGFNPSGHVDRSLPCLRVTASDGKIMAALFQVACHNTTLGSRNFEMCGDYAGFAQFHLEAKYPGTNAMFMTGCAGNANPYPRGTMEIAEQHGRDLATEVSRLLESELRPVNGPLNTALTQAELSLQAAKPRAELEGIVKNGPNWLRGSASTMLEMMDRGESLPTHYSARSVPGSLATI